MQQLELKSAVNYLIGTAIALCTSIRRAGQLQRSANTIQVQHILVIEFLQMILFKFNIQDHADLISLDTGSKKALN